MIALCHWMLALKFGRGTGSRCWRSGRLAAWLILVGTIVAVGSDAASDNIFNVTGWVALGFGTAALVFSVAGITMIRTRGETALAILALVLTLSLTSFVSPLLFGFVR